MRLLPVRKVVAADSTDLTRTRLESSEGRNAKGWGLVDSVAADHPRPSAPVSAAGVAVNHTCGGLFSDRKVYYPPAHYSFAITRPG